MGDNLTPDGLDEVAWHSIDTNADVLAKLSTTADGLSSDEASSRLAVFGRNMLTPPPKRTIWQRLWAQVNTYVFQYNQSSYCNVFSKYQSEQGAHELHSWPPGDDFKTSKICIDIEGRSGCKW